MSTPTTPDHLSDFLTITDAARLGAGDTIAGANLLAAMACSLANISRPGSGLVSKDGASIAIGSSLLVSGSLSSSMVTEKVLGRLAARQNNLISHINAWGSNLQDEANKPGLKLSHSDNPAGAYTYLMESAYNPVFKDDPVEAARHWEGMVQKPVCSDFRTLAKQHMAYITGHTAEQLSKQLERCHMGRPLVYVGIDRADDFAHFDHVCDVIMDGRVTAGSESIRGTMVVTDPSGFLGETVRAEKSVARWVSRMLWLVDGNAGPEPREDNAAKPLVKLDILEVRYEAALDSAWGQRFNNWNTAPVHIKSEFTNSQARWVAFLKTMEPTLPGITGSARSLLATLVFGFLQMTAGQPVPKDFKWDGTQIGALARFLVRRMANARAVMLHDAENARKRRLSARIIHILAEGPIGVRDLTRHFHKLPMPECREVLFELMSTGNVLHSGNKWRLAEPAVRVMHSPQPLTLEA